MRKKTPEFVAVLACSVLTLAGAASADDKKDDKDRPSLSGAWVRKEGEVKLEFSDKDVLKIAPHGKEEVLLVLCKYTVGKEGVVKVKITDFEGKEEVKEKAKEKLPVGTEFSFTWKVKDDTATLGDLKGDDVELLKSHLEGDYDKKK
jgi:hypothetical protein